MNFRVRADHIVKSVINEQLHGGLFCQVLIDRVEEGLREVARASRREGLQTAANAIGHYAREMQLSEPAKRIAEVIFDDVRELARQRQRGS